MSKRKRVTVEQAFERWWAKNTPRSATYTDLDRARIHDWSKAAHYRGYEFGRRREKSK